MPRSCSREGDGRRPAEARHPRPAGAGRRELTASARVRGGRGARWSRRRPRARSGRPRGRTGAAQADVRAAAREPADRELRDRRATALSEARPRIAVVTFPGSNDDRDAAWALGALGAEAVPVWHAEPELPAVAAVVVPGGFSYGDYLRCGAIARFSPATAAIVEFAAAGGLVLGICNGFQILCEAGLLPGVLLRNADLRFVCRDVPLVVERADTPFTSRCSQGQRLVIPVKHGEGRHMPPSDPDPSPVGLPHGEACTGRAGAI